MFIEQIYTKCLAEAAYYIESEGEAAIIDPLRDIAPYLALAEKRKAVIKYVFETHFHADFVSGHIDLAQQTGADIVFGPTELTTGYSALIGYDGQEFKLGGASLKLLHTPGHTMESACYLLTEENGKTTSLFTGDTLFIGDVGRPDLAQKVIAELTQDKLAGHLFDSLRNKIMPLADELIVYPGHGAGSACGKNMSKETSDTLGHQKKVNYALNPLLSKEEFVKEVLNGLVPPPGYFPQNVIRNITGYEGIDIVVNRGAKALGLEEFVTEWKKAKAQVIDSRDAQTFAAGFIPGSINIGLEGNFAVWTGTLIEELKQPILIIAEPGKEEEVIIRLARVGYDNSLGFLKGGFDAWKRSGKPVDTINSIEASEFEKIANHSHPNILDVRKNSEFESQHVKDAVNAPLDYIREKKFRPRADRTYYVYCGGGYRSMTYISMLKAEGYEHLIDVKGGFSAIKNEKGFKLTEYVCPTSLL
ncbi:MAG: MBL fold metallo-hydrolase [bacterium]|nr:MBL fold metallo-hydrolase [bacterium]